jgi:fatty-acyl-CoA synthase
MLTAMLGHPSLARRDLSSLRYAMSGGALAPAELVRRVEAALGIPFVITLRRPSRAARSR